MFNFTYNTKNIENVVFFINNNDLVAKKKNVVVNYNKLLKTFVDFRFSFFVEIV